MTAAKSAGRGVRRSVGSAIKRLTSDEVADLELCFAGKQGGAWCLLLPGYERSRDEALAGWAAWKATHRGARPPAGYEWLNATKPNTPGAA